MLSAITKTPNWQMFRRLDFSNSIVTQKQFVLGYKLLQNPNKGSPLEKEGMSYKIVGRVHPITIFHQSFQNNTNQTLQMGLQIPFGPQV